MYIFGDIYKLSAIFERQKSKKKRRSRKPKRVSNKQKNKKKWVTLTNI